MGGKGSKDAAAGSKNATAGSAPLTPPAAAPEDAAMAQMQRYGEFRNKLLSFSLGEAAYDYAERLYRENSDSPEIMALLAETAVLYDEQKVKGGNGRVESRPHWVDRMDLLQRGIDVTRKCIRDHPDYGPCHRSLMMCASRAADAEYNNAYVKGLGDQIHYAGLMKRGEDALAVVQDAQIYNAMAALNGRVLSRSWTLPGIVGWWYGVPRNAECLKRAIRYSTKACELAPNELEFRCRLAMAQYQAGDLVNARRNFVKVRDEMVVKQLADDKWQSIAHTQLSTGFTKSRWNVPFA